MCDLWKTTLTQKIEPGAIPRQIDAALARLSLPTDRKSVQIKLYNGGSFFDPNAIPKSDYSAIAERVASFDRVIVESHPAFVGEGVRDFQSALHKSTPSPPALEVAMGLETANPNALDMLNKRMSLDQFVAASQRLQSWHIALRVFVLIHPPFIGLSETLAWTQRSVEFAFHTGASVVSLIPTRPGNGAMEDLQELGVYTPPCLSELEFAFATAFHNASGRVFLDLWDLEQFSKCRACFPARKARLQRMNLEQKILPTVACPSCGNS